MNEYLMLHLGEIILLSVLFIFILLCLYSNFLMVTTNYYYTKDIRMYN